MWAPGQGPNPTPSTPPRKPRPSVKPKKKRNLFLSILKWTVIVGLGCSLLLVGTVAFVFWMYGRDPSLPDYRKLSDYHPKQAILVLDANDRRIGEIYGPDKKIERRTFVPYDQIPAHVVDAFVAAEDNRFWTHGGVDYWGMFRAFIQNVRSGKKKSGASTITQQVVKTFLLTPEKTFKRKIQEIIIARRLEKSLTKQEIMTLYLNQIYFGNHRYGIQEAARFYFGKDVQKINVGEAALLASLPQRPEELAPNRKKNQAAAKARQIYVLNQLVEMKKLAAPDAQKWIDAPIAVIDDPFPYMDTAPEWISKVRQELVDDLKAQKKDQSELDTMGGTVRTTLDPGLQANAQHALQNGLRAVDKRHKIGRPQRSVKPEQVDAEIAKLAKSFGGKLKAKETYPAVVTGVFDEDNEISVDLGNYKAAIILGDEVDARYNPPDDQGKTKKPSERFKIGDVVETAYSGGEVKPKHADKHVMFAPGPEGAVVVIEVKTRKVRALVGGYQTKKFGLNRATDAHRQPGSSFKPFVFGTGIEMGQFTPASRVPDTLQYFEQVGKAWKPKNYDGKTDGYVLLRTALNKSINTVSIFVTVKLDPKNVVAFAHKMGIESDIPAENSIALGSGEVTPLEMTNAITTYASGGIYAKPRFIEAVNGKVREPEKGERVIDEKVAYVVTDMMRTVVTSGTGHLANELKIPIAGKTGTSNDAKDVWFVGMTPDYVIGTWIGYDDPKEMGKETGGTTAVPVFVELMKTMNQPAKSFTRPAGIIPLKIDKETGLLAPDGAPKGSTIDEIFIQGTQPTEYAPLAGEVTDKNEVKNEYDD